MTTQPDEPPAESIDLEVHLEAPREKVWRALSIPQIAAEWLTPATPAAEHEVIAAEPPERIRYRVREPEGARFAIESTVTFELRAAPGGGTLLRITHDEFELAATASVAMSQPLSRRRRARAQRRRRLLRVSALRRAA